MNGNKLTKASWIIFGIGFVLAFLGMFVMVASNPTVGACITSVGLVGALLYLLWLFIQAIIAAKRSKKPVVQAVAERQSIIIGEDDDERIRLASVDQKAYWIRNKLCRHCGGEFEGFFAKKCKNCGKSKDY